MKLLTNAKEAVSPIAFVHIANDTHQKESGEFRRGRAYGHIAIYAEYKESGCSRKSPPEELNEGVKYLQNILYNRDVACQ